MYVWMYVWMYVCMYRCMYVCMYVCMYIDGLLFQTQMFESVYLSVCNMFA